jgi:hypothetical protein
MKTLNCPRLHENVRVDITQENCIAFHECLDDDACPLAGCFSKELAGNRKEESYNPANPRCKFGDIA